MESIPILITLLIIIFVSVLVVVPFILSIPLIIVGIFLLIRQKRKFDKERNNKSRLPTIMIVSGSFMFIVLGYQILQFIKSVFY